MLNIEEELKKFLKDVRLNIDNNPAERLNRGIAIIRKNCLFAGSEAGGQRLAILLCKSQGAEPSILRFLFIFFVRPSFLPYETKNSICNFLQFYFKTCNCFAFSIKKSDTVIGNGSILNPRILLFHSKNSIRKLYLSSHPEQG